jgi:hypothetical protein
MMRARISAMAGAVAVLVAVVAGGCAADTADRITTTVDIGCGDATQVAPVDWYLPPAGSDATALVWLQHGFVESKDDWREIAPTIAAHGLVVMATSLPTFDPSGCNVEDLGGNGPYLDRLAGLFAGIGRPDGALARSYASALDVRGGNDRHDHDRPALPTRTVFVGHSAGGETVLGVAARLHADHPRAFVDLGGLVLEDPVASFLGSNFADALRDLGPTHLPILTLASPPNACNAYQSGITQIDRLLGDRPFRGAQITTGTHGDVFGTAVMPLEAVACGVPKPGDVDAVQTLTRGWVADEAAGTHDPTWYPGGSVYDGYVADGTLTSLG